MLTIVSWNIAGGRPINSLDHFDYQEENLDYFISNLAQISPDIVCFQESHINDNRSLAKEIAEKLQLPNVYEVPTSNSHIDPKYKLANAILSKFPIESKITYQFPVPHFELRWMNGKLADRHDKELQVVRINNMWIANTQLMPIHIWGYDYMKGPGKELAEKVESVFLNLQEPLIFCGDFNVNDTKKIFPGFFKKTQLKESLPNKTTRPTKSDKKLTPDHIYYSPKCFYCEESGVINTHTDHYLCYAKFEVISRAPDARR